MTRALTIIAAVLAIATPAAANERPLRLTRRTEAVPTVDGRDADRFYRDGRRRPRSHHPRLVTSPTDRSPFGFLRDRRCPGVHPGRVRPDLPHVWRSGALFRLRRQR